MRTPEEFKEELELASAEVRASIKACTVFTVAGASRSSDGVAADRRQVCALRAWLKLIDSIHIPDR